jgi:signal transduction histidine kinase
MHRRVPEPGGDDEIGRLALTMNAMLGRLQGAAVRQRQFVSDASHELRSPVAAIRTDVEVALREGGAADWPTVGRAVLVEEDRLERLLADLLLLALGDEDGNGGGPARAPAETLVDVAALARAEAERGRRVPVTAVVADDPPPPTVAGSSGALTRVVANLVDNAARHAREEVRITVSAFPVAGGPGVRLVVDDDGPGIPEADRERVFERFTRLDDARARDRDGDGGGGAGLGLAVVRSVVTRHRGMVRAEAAPGGGARLVVELPAWTGSPPASPAAR